MRTYFRYILIALLSCAVSCTTNDEIADPNSEGKMSLRLVSSAMTRASDAQHNEDFLDKVDLYLFGNTANASLWHTTIDTNANGSITLNQENESLDELMQIFNVINGTMSFVGPRPTLPYQVENYTEHQKKRMLMRPGVTGWAQVNGRNDLTWSEKIEYDIEYVEKFSLWFDIRICLKTVSVVLKQDGIAFTKNDAITAKSTNASEDKEPATIEK